MAEPENSIVDDDMEEMEDEEDTEQSENAKNISQAILRRPDLLAALQGRLHSEMLESLPPQVKRRLKALKKLQLEATKIEAKFYEEVHLLECKYHKAYLPLYEKRGEVISGTYEPTDVECEWESDDDEDKEAALSADLKAKVTIEEAALEEKSKNDINKNQDVKGIPDFWLTIFKNVQMLSEMVQEHDEAILKHLMDVKVKFLESNPMGFILEFHFSPNEFFTNTVLTKEYEMKCVPEENDPFSFEGPEIYKCKGCAIDWKRGKNVTVKTIKKKQKHRSRGSVRTVTKTVQNDSFFNFFSPPAIADDQLTEVDEDVQAILTSDFEIGHYIRERIVPRAVLYFTGEALEDEDFEEEEDDDDEDEEGDEEEDDENEDFQPQGGKPGDNNKGANPAECKQQ